MDIKIALICISALLLTPGCSSMNSAPASGSRSITPEQISQSRRSPDATSLEWGGIIVNVENMEHSSELQITAYPLTRSGRPDTDEPPAGRFIAVSEGYLESFDYARGRQVTVSGKIDRLRAGKVGESEYLFPVMLAQDIHLWPKQYGSSLTPRFNFGLGVGSGGSTRGSIGIGIGF